MGMEDGDLCSNKKCESERLREAIGAIRACQ